MNKVIINYIQGGKYPILLYDDIVEISQRCGYQLYLQPLQIYGNYYNGKDIFLKKLRYNFSKIPVFIKTLMQIPRNSKVLSIWNTNSIILQFIKIEKMQYNICMCRFRFF